MVTRAKPFNEWSFRKFRSYNLILLLLLFHHSELIIRTIQLHKDELYFVYWYAFWLILNLLLIVWVIAMGNEEISKGPISYKNFLKDTLNY